jgi:hypothetical protein
MIVNFFVHFFFFLCSQNENSNVSNDIFHNSDFDRKTDDINSLGVVLLLPHVKDSENIFSPCSGFRDSIVPSLLPHTLHSEDSTEVVSSSSDAHESEFDEFADTHICSYCGGENINLENGDCCDDGCLGKQFLFVEVSKQLIYDDNRIEMLKNTVQETSDSLLLIIPFFLGCSKCMSVCCWTGIVDHLNMCLESKNRCEHADACFRLISFTDVKDYCPKLFCNTWENNNDTKETNLKDTNEKYGSERVMSEIDKIVKKKIKEYLLCGECMCVFEAKERNYKQKNKITLDKFEIYFEKTLSDSRYCVHKDWGIAEDLGTPKNLLHFWTPKKDSTSKCSRTSESSKTSESQSSLLRRWETASPDGGCLDECVSGSGGSSECELEQVQQVHTRCGVLFLLLF